MEPWQVSHIQKNIYNLQRFTICNSSFRAVLREHGVLVDNDISQLNALSNSKGQHDESELLYNLLLTREGAFNALIDACNRTQQTGALRILKQVHVSKSTTWNEVSEELKNELGNKIVNFQGNQVKLSECCNHLHHLINGQFLKELEERNTPTLVKNQVPEQVEYYIHRTLRCRNKLKSSVFQQPCDDIFVVEGMEKHQLTNLVAGAETDVSGNQIRSLTVRFILLEYEKDFEGICKLAHSPVHMIRYKDNIYEWVRSSGSVKSLQKYVDDAQDCFLEGELASIGNRVNVIPDSPGMGKTVLLANVAHQISKEKPNMLIRFILLKDFIQALSKKSINLESIVSLIAEQSSDFECGREIVKHILTSESCILMFDGFDEVLFHQIATAKKILKTIVSLKSAQVFITTRPHMREELENTLHVLGFTINPFMEADQVEFLLKFWEMNGATVNENLSQFATSCVKAISSNMTDFERDIAGIPLQCKLHAETYTEEAVRYSEIGVLGIKSQAIGQINSIFEMYEIHMKMRLDNLKIKTEEIKHIHAYYALDLHFPEHAHQFQALKTSSIPLNELCDVGFLEATNSEDIRFVHRTFAEFFVAWFVVEMKMTENISSFVLNELLATKPREEFITTPFGKTHIGKSFTFNYPVIAYFINGFTKIYAKNSEGQDQTQRVSMLINSIHYGQVSRIFLASAVSDYQFVPLAVSLFFDTSKLGEKGDSKINELLLISANHSGVSLMKTFCPQRDLTNLKIRSKFDSFVLTPLHVAVQRGHYYLVEFLARKYEHELKSLRYLLHFCVFESQEEKKQIISDKVQIIKLLSRKSNVCMNEKLPDGTVPLLQRNVYCELIQCLIECRADVNLLDKNENTILHKICENPVTTNFYHWLVVSLNERNFKYFNQLNWKKVSPLHCAVEQVELLPETLKYLYSCGTDFNVLDEDEESPLFYAIRAGRSVSLIRSLIELGSDWKKKNNNNDTLLHLCAKNAHCDALKYFLQNYKFNVNAKDKNNNTPLHLAVMRSSKEQESTQQLLITSGADVNAHTTDSYLLRQEEKTMMNRFKKALRLKTSSKYSSSKNYTPFKKAFKEGKGLTVNILKLMEEHGLSIQPNKASEALKDLLSNTNIMAWEIDKEFVKVLQFLIGKGGKIKDFNIFRNTNVSIWESEEVQSNMKAIIEATDLFCLWTHVKTSGLLTQSELEEIQNLPTDSFKKCECFYKTVQTKTGSFEQVCLLLVANKQMSPFLLLRQSLDLYFRPYSDNRMFVTPPTFTHQFLHSQQNSSFNIMALVTTNSYLTISRIRDTIKETVDVLNETEISSQFQKIIHKDLIVVKVRVVTIQLITKLEETGVGQCKIILVCSRVSEDVKNCHVATDALSTWDDISTRYLDSKARFRLFHGSFRSMNKIFESPEILSKLSRMQWVANFNKLEYSVVKFKMGHIELDVQSKSYLCPTIFHYVLPGKLVFKGISIEKLQEYARFGHKIGFFGDDDVDNLDLVVVEQPYEFDEICKQTSENVHLIEYEKKKGVFELVKTRGWDENIQWFLKKRLCEGFPHCDCASDNKNLFVKLLIKSKRTVHPFDYLLHIQELTMTTLKIMKLEDAEELFNIRALLNRLGGEEEAEHTDFPSNSHSEQLINLVTEQLSPFLVESELYHVAINTLFPTLANQRNVDEGLEQYQQLGMLKQVEKNSFVFVHKSLAWYFIAKLLMELTENVEFEEITSVLRKEVFQNCFNPQEVKASNKYKSTFLLVSRNSYSHLLRSYEFINIKCFRFIDTFLKTNSVYDNANFSWFLKSIIAAEPEGSKWIHACVNGNLFHLLQLILSLNVNSFSSAFESEDLVVLAVNHADLPVTQLVTTRFKNETKRRLTDIKIYLRKRVYDMKEISMVSLAALTGHYSVVEYLLNDDGIRTQFNSQEILREVHRYCVENSCHYTKYEISLRKRIVHLLLHTQSDMTLAKQCLLFSKNIHVELILYLIELGVDYHTKNTDNKNILHLCPEYLTPQEYHKVVEIIHSKDNTRIARLFLEFDSEGETAFHVAVQHLELLDETLAVILEAGVNFNALNRTNNSVYFHAVKHFRSARVLDALHRFGANIQERDYRGRPVSVFCKNNQVALQ